MKKILLSTAAIALLFASSCKKDDDSGPSNTWTIGSSTYGAASVTGNGNTLMATSGSGSTASTLSISFNGSALPTTGGDYTIVAGSPAANQLAFTGADVSGTTSRIFTSNGSSTVKAKVTVSGNKVSVSMPSTDATLFGGSGNVSVSANITQTN